MSDARDPSLDAILASIRRAVAEGPMADDLPPLEPLPEPAPRAPAVTIGELEVEPVIGPPPPTTGPGGLTLEALMRSLLDPMLRDWLDANLPAIVDQAVMAEIERLTSKRR